MLLQAADAALQAADTRLPAADAALFFNGFSADRQPSLSDNQGLFD